MANNGVGYITQDNKEEQRITKYASGKAVLLTEATPQNVNSCVVFSPLKARR